MILMTLVRTVDHQRQLAPIADRADGAVVNHEQQLSHRPS